MNASDPSTTQARILLNWLEDALQRRAEPDEFTNAAVEFFRIPLADARGLYARIRPAPLAPINRSIN